MRDKNIIKQFLYDRDMFGHQVSLNFNKKGDKSYTKFGGFVSLLIQVLMAVVAGILINKLVRKEDATNMMRVHFLDLDETPALNYSHLNMTIFHVLKKGGNNPVFINNETNRYINIVYVQADSDFNKG